MRDRAGRNGSIGYGGVGRHCLDQQHGVGLENGTAIGARQRSCGPGCRKLLSCSTDAANCFCGNTTFSDKLSIWWWQQGDISTPATDAINGSQLMPSVNIAISPNIKVRKVRGSWHCWRRLAATDKYASNGSP